MKKITFILWPFELLYVIWFTPVFFLWPSSSVKCLHKNWKKYSKIEGLVVCVCVCVYPSLAPEQMKDRALKV